MRKRILAFALAMVMICSLLPVMTIEAKAVATYNYTDMLARAEAIVNYEWVPSHDIKTWNGNKYNGRTYFAKGETVKGMPYTLFTTNFGVDSLVSLAKYKEVYSQNETKTSGKTGPLYGSCCATFVSEVFGGEYVKKNGDPRYDSVRGIRNSPGSTSATTYWDVTIDQIQKGDALSAIETINGSEHRHIIWIGEVTDTHITVYEQTPPVARKKTVSKANCSNNGYFKFGSLTYKVATRVLGTEIPSQTVAFDTDTVSNITSTNATISTWTSNSGNITEMGYYIGCNPNEQNRIVTNSSPVGWTRFECKYDINSTYGKLSPGTKYTYIFFVVSNGVEYKSYAKEFTTKGCAQITYDTHSCDDVYDTNAIIGAWFSNPSGANISSLGFEYSENGGPLKQVTVAQNVGWTRSHQRYDTKNYVTLRACTSYSFRFYATANGNTYYSNFIDFSTVSPQLAFDTYVCENIKENTADISVWFSNESAKHLNSIGFYLGKSGETMKRYEITKDVGWTRSHLQYNVKDYTGNLLPSTKYTYQFYIVANGAEYKSELKTFKTSSHTHSLVTDQSVLATCEKTGLTEGSHCSLCNTVIQKQEITPATGHSTELKNRKSATCTVDGYTGDEVCKTCGKTIKTGKTIDAIDHKWDSGKVTKEATCKAAGEKTFTCQNDSSHTKTVIILATDHKDTNTDYKCDYCGKSLCTAHSSVPVEGKPATCTEAGLTEGAKCPNCGEILAKQKEIPPTGHSTELKNTKSATCIADGYTGDEICKTCGKTVKSGEVIKATGHKWDSGKVTKEATCTADGVKKFTCQNDSSHTRTEVIPATGHKDTNNNYICDNCSKSLCSNHSSVTVQGKAATCTEAGLTDGAKCSKCGKIITAQKEIPATGHSTELKNKKSATCTADGYAGDEICKTCGKTVKSGEVIKATGHKWDSGKVIKEATETAEGTKRFTCSVCNGTKEETIPVIDHKHSFKDTVLNPTCTEGGYTLHKCSCGENYKDTYTDATGHTTELKNKKSATCTADGYTGDEICKTCGKTVKSGKVIKATGHSYTNGNCTVCGAADPNYTAPTTNPFTDVANTDCFYTPVLWAYNANVTGGTSATTFGPNNPCTRAQVVTFMWAAEGRPEPTTSKNPFTDVTEKDWYYKAVLWAVENGITYGTSATTFSPNQNCTRAQIVTFLYAAEGKPAVNSKSTFTDVANDAWFAKPVIWAAENDVTGGIGDGKFGPTDVCTRRQIVTFLFKVHNNK